jgi:hypothetical protein
MNAAFEDKTLVNQRSVFLFNKKTYMYICSTLIPRENEYMKAKKVKKRDVPVRTLP